MARIIWAGENQGFGPNNTQVLGQRVQQRKDQDANQLDTDCTEKISVEEVRECIRRLKNRKAPGICGITGEMLKAGGDVVVQWLHRIFRVAWESGTVPTDWRKAQIVPVHKKGSRTQCKNYRGISLLSVPGKVYATVLEKRIRAITEEKVLEEQGAFRRKRSCIDQIFIVRQLGEKVYICTLFIHYTYHCRQQNIWGPCSMTKHHVTMRLKIELGQ